MLKRLVLNEYLPWTGHAVTWILVLLLLGQGQAAPLATAALLLMAVRSLTRVRTRALFAALPDAAPAAISLRRRMGVQIAVGGLFAAAVLTGVLLCLFAATKQRPVFEALLAMSVGLPARYLLTLVAPRSNAVARFRIVQAWSGVALALALMVGGADGLWAALALALRDWLGLLAVVTAPPRGHDPQAMDAASAPREPPTPAALWRQVVESNRQRARRRLALQAAHMVLHPLLGPFGSLLTRTARGARLDRRLSHLMPSNVVAMTGGAVVLWAVGLALLLGGDGLLHPLLGASVIRAAAAATWALLWIRARPGPAGEGP